MNRIYLIRHTEVKEKGICYGRTDVNLQDDYESSLHSISEHVKNYIDFENKGSFPSLPPSVIITSPSSRTDILAAHLSKKLSIHCKPDHRLMEMNFGEWEGQTWSSIANRQDIWLTKEPERPAPGGESLMQVFLRTKNFIDENKDQSMILVTHGGPIRTILCYIASIPLEKAFTFEVDFGSISVLRKTRAGLKIELLNVKHPNTKND